MAENFNEFTRVQIPALLHLERLGYTFIHHSDLVSKDPDSNILTDVFTNALHRLNPEIRDTEIQEKLRELIRIADNDDLGREFYRKLTDTSHIRLIDFDHPENNDWRCTIELECESQSTHNRFRPDITCFINGLPLVHIEVKKPNNREGMLAERERMNARMRQRDFRRFLNITQMMIFSNNEEYDTESRVPVQGAFYATISRDKICFNVFREAHSSYYETLRLPDMPASREQEILSRLGASVLCSLPEYNTNKSATTPTNRILSSLLARERILFFLRYGLAYLEVPTKNERGDQCISLEKHIMRYPQFFANRAICANLDKGINSGTIWHTQGSGKTALAYFAVKVLTDYFARKNAVARFYFIVDRIALMEQAMQEFAIRGLKVFTAQSRRELMHDFEQNVTMRGTDGQPEITVVNIQKFDEQQDRLEPKYSTNIQRIFFVDEAHRSYSFGSVSLANLMNSDTHAVRIALTGTPLLKSECETWRIFGHYYDKYYYDKSIADGFTLRLMREDIETDYKDKLLNIIQEEFPDDIQVNKKDLTKDMIIESDNYVNTLIEYVTHDLIRFRKEYDDTSVAGMLVCETNRQARKVKQMFDAYQTEQSHPSRAELILHDEGDPEQRKAITENFKHTNDIDILIVNQMLLTGFDAHRLKRLYLTRKMQGHDLLQALTRVNRPYKDFRYGYVIDFAGIKDNFEEANDQYIRELNACDSTDTPDSAEPRQLLGDAIMEHKEEILDKLKEIKQAIFAYDCTNAENLRKQLDDENIPSENLYQLRNALEEAKALTNQIRTFGDDELRRKLSDMEAANSNFSNLLAVVNDHIARVNLKEKMEHTEDVHGMVNYILSEMEYRFTLKEKGELAFVWDDKMQDKLRQAVEEFESNFDNEADDFKKLLESFKKYYREKGFKPMTRQEIEEKIGYLDGVIDSIRDINRRNIVLKHKFNDDERYVRIYKRIEEQNGSRTTQQPYIISKADYERVEALNKMKQQIDEVLYKDERAMDNEEFFRNTVRNRVFTTLVAMNLLRQNVSADIRNQNMQDIQEISRLIISEYTNQYKQYTFKTA